MGAPQYEQAGADVAGSGTLNTIPRWTGATTLGDSLLSQSGNTIAQVASVNGAVAFNVTNQNTGASAYSAVEIDSAGASWRLKSIRTAGMFAIERNGVVAMQIDNLLNFGIGTAAPVGRADIAGTSVDQLAWGLLSVRSNDAQGADKGGSIAFGGIYDASNTTHWAQISGRKENGTSGQYGGYLAFATRTNGSGANTERARIDSSGNVGIGTTSPPNLALYTTLAVSGTNGGRVQLMQGASTAATFVADGSVATIGSVWAVDIRLIANNVERLRCDTSGNVIVNTAAIATNATNGFLYVPSCAGTPTGTPTTYTGRVPIVVDTTNNKLYFYSGGSWRDAGP